VFEDNEAALTLYRSLGFVDAHRPADEQPSDALYMEYDLRRD
jgi:ribosomal protein S18 acetylase RimI-like enzyme